MTHISLQGVADKSRVSAFRDVGLPYRLFSTLALAQLPVRSSTNYRIEGLLNYENLMLCGAGRLELCQLYLNEEWTINDKKQRPEKSSTPFRVNNNY